jgi:hypothetical protein
MAELQEELFVGINTITAATFQDVANGQLRNYLEWPKTALCFLAAPFPDFTQTPC